MILKKIKETEVTEKLRSDQELLELKKSYANLDEEQEVMRVVNYHQHMHLQINRQKQKCQKSILWRLLWRN